ncbi:hypothetical protein J2X31_001602 [Flavobacterium arsenatis]|uniref:Uncharacterized protein n=1 Tax=Flavobacterium arsenatis TaxID=1484332 RepID=A0ABU1TNR7_9FLAO|nr:hypothetical protein [Flavobacterium arsenatis]
MMLFFKIRNRSIGVFETIFLLDATIFHGEPRHKRIVTTIRVRKKTLGFF